MHIRSRIVKDLGEPSRLHNIDKSNTERSSEDEAVSARPGDQSKNTDTGDGDSRVQEDLHPTEDRRWHRAKDCSEFPEDTHEDEEAGCTPSCSATCAACERNDSVVASL